MREARCPYCGMNVKFDASEDFVQCGHCGQILQVYVEGFTEFRLRVVD
jgi:ribosomal protein S27E